jgi:hypothetical protein
MSSADYSNPDRYFGDQAEILGHRLDLARECKKNARSAWAQHYWGQVVAQLIVQWQNSPAVNHGQSLCPATAKWTVDFDFFETDFMGSLLNFDLEIFDRIFRTNLDDSWERERTRKLIGGY